MIIQYINYNRSMSLEGVVYKQMIQFGATFYPFLCIEIINLLHYIQLITRLYNGKPIMNNNKKFEIPQRWTQGCILETYFGLLSWNQ